MAKIRDFRRRNAEQTPRQHRRFGPTLLPQTQPGSSRRNGRAEQSVLMQRNEAGIEYWRRLDNGGVYAGARPFLDMLANRHGIDETVLLSLQDSEIKAVGQHIRTLLEKRK